MPEKTQQTKVHQIFGEITKLNDEDFLNLSQLIILDHDIRMMKALKGPLEEFSQGLYSIPGGENANAEN